MLPVNVNTMTDPHGFALLMPGGGMQGEQSKVYHALLAAGFASWDGNGLPAFVVLHGGAPKHQFFQAGYLAGARVPLFLIGRESGLRKRHSEAVNALGGWSLHVPGADELLDAIARRGLRPGAWDEAQLAARLAAVTFAAGDGELGGEGGHGS
jgi:hypothetical protein